MADPQNIAISSTGSLQLDDHAGVVSDVLFFSIGEGAIVIDERGHIARVNQIALDILGYEAEDLVGKWYPGTVVAEDHEGHPIPNMERPITEVFFTGKPVYRKLYYQCRGGHRVPVALTVSPVMQEGKPIGAIELFRDISDELRLEHAKDEFISIASHQLRTPATVVKQYLGMILDGFVESEDTRMNMIRTAYEHNDNELEIINDLLKVAQMEANKLTTNFDETEVCGLLHKILSGQEPEFKKRDIGLQLISDTDEAIVCMDVLHLQMVLENLISNANKYSNPGTKVQVEVKTGPDSVTISVSDQGIGIAEEDIPKLFNKFSRIVNPESTAGGTGLGLYWAKKLVELYNGTISVSSAVRQGSTFVVCLPGKGSA